MEYTLKEQEVLELMKRTDFKNLSKNDVLSFATKLSELRPEVAKEILNHFPDYVDLIKSQITEYRLMLDEIIRSDDESLNQYYNIANKQMDSSEEKTRKLLEIIELCRKDCSKILDSQDLSIDEALKIIDREMEFIKLAQEVTKESNVHEQHIEDKVNKKDTEKRMYNWKLVGTVGVAVVAVVGVSAGILGGNFNLKLPNKNS